MKTARLVTRVAATLVVTLWLVPVGVLAILSLHETSEHNAHKPLSVLISRPTGANYKHLFTDDSVRSAAANSAVCAACATVVCYLVTLPAAYNSAITRRDRRPRGFFTWLLSTRMLPAAAVAIPFLVVGEALHVNRSNIGLSLIIAATQVPVAAWLARQTLAEIPAFVCDALRIDGATEFGIVRFAVLPLATPGLLGAMLYVFVFAWNEYVVTMLIVSDEARKTLPLRIADYFTGYQNDWGPMLAATTVMLAPAFVAAFMIGPATRTWLSARDRDPET